MNDPAGRLSAINASNVPLVSYGIEYGNRVRLAIQCDCRFWRESDWLIKTVLILRHFQDAIQTDMRASQGELRYLSEFQSRQHFLQSQF